MKEGLLKEASELFLKEIQSVLTMIYILMIGIGMLFNYKKYIVFGINIFEYADLFEFLVAPFQDAKIMITAVLSAVIPIGIFWLDSYTRRRYPEKYSKANFGLDKRPWYLKLRLISFAFILIYFVAQASTWYAQYYQKSIQSQAFSTITFTDGSILRGKIVGQDKRSPICPKC